MANSDDQLSEDNKPNAIKPMDRENLVNKIVLDIEGFYISCLTTTDGDKKAAKQLFKKIALESQSSLHLWLKSLPLIALSAKQNNVESVQYLQELMDEKLFNLTAYQPEHKHTLH